MQIFTQIKRGIKHNHIVVPFSPVNALFGVRWEQKPSAFGLGIFAAPRTPDKTAYYVFSLYQETRFWRVQEASSLLVSFW